jgi:hypothetical protein
VSVLASLPAPLQVTVEVHALDTGRHEGERERCWRVTRAIGPAGVTLEAALPFEAGRPVEVLFGIPDDEQAFVVRGEVAELAAPRDAEDDRPRPQAIAFIGLDDATRARIDRYCRERMLLP